MAPYYLFKNGQSSGPFSPEQLEQMAKSGFFSGSELYMEEGGQSWKPISQLPGFVPGTLAAVPPAAKGTNCLVISLVVGGVALVLVMFLSLLAAIAVPNFLRARKRSQANREMMQLRMIDAAIDQYAIEHNKRIGSPVEWADLQRYFPPDSELAKSGNRDILGNPFGPNFTVDVRPAVPTATYEALSDVAPAEFWSPFKSQ